MICADSTSILCWNISPFFQDFDRATKSAASERVRTNAGSLYLFFSPPPPPLPSNPLPSPPPIKPPTFLLSNPLPLSYHTPPPPTLEFHAIEQYFTVCCLHCYLLSPLYFLWTAHSRTSEINLEIAEDNTEYLTEGNYCCCCCCFVCSLIAPYPSVSHASYQ